MLSGEDWSAIRDELSKIVRKRNNPVTNETGVIVECFLEAFGWSDFIVLLWGTNVEMIKKAIIKIRDICKAYSSTIIGVSPEEKELRSKELKENIEAAQSKDVVTYTTYRPVKADNIFEEYIGLQKALLLEMENELGKKVRPRKLGSQVLST